MDADAINLEPKYTSSEAAGKCLICLAEQELNKCVRELLGEETDNEKAQAKFEALVAFLQSPESLKLRDESEKYLAENKQVKLKLNFVNGKIDWQMDVTSNSPE